nr:MAG TPA: hypothetical protein [Caudoviricetes sp.]
MLTYCIYIPYIIRFFKLIFSNIYPLFSFKACIKRALFNYYKFIFI